MSEYIEREDVISILTLVVNSIKDLPSADVEERKRGEWKGVFCSNCGCEAITEWNETGAGYCLSNFCPNCGADMRGKQDE